MSSPEDALPWVGLYAGVASLVCTLAMAADVFHGFKLWKLWFPCRYFTINAASVTLIAIALKLPVDLTTKMSSKDDLNAKYVSMIFFFTMLANSLPSLGLMDDKELLMNTIALAILIITFYVNVWIQFSTSVLPLSLLGKLLLIFPLLCFFSIALTVPASRKILEHRYKELRRLMDSNHQGKKFSFKKLTHYVKKYWMMAETGDPQFVLACSPVSSAFGILCIFLAVLTYPVLITVFRGKVTHGSGKSDYKWSIGVIIIVQSIGVVVGSIAPIFRCFTSISYFDLSKKWSMNHLNVFKVEKYWTQMLQKWKQSRVRSHIPGRYSKKVFHDVKSMILKVCIALQIMLVVISKMTCLVPRFCLIIFSCFCYLCKSSLRKSKEELESSNNNARSEMEEYSIYVLQIDEEANLSKTILRNMLSSITKHLQESEEKEPRNLMKLLEKSIGFKGVLEFDSDQVPHLHPEEFHNCWSLAAVILTTIAVSLPNIADCNVKGLLASMREGLRFVRHVEESISGNRELVKARKASRHIWTEVEVYNRWLHTNLQNNARKGKTSEEILQWFSDESVKAVKQFKRCKNTSMDHSLHEFIAASSMNRISQTILQHCNDQEEWPKDEEIFEWLSSIIADLLCACFTNLPRVIKMKCHHDAIEKREDSIRIAAQLLGKSKKILKILKARQVPSLDMDSMAYIDKWHALQESEIPNGCASSSSDDLLTVTIEQ